MPKQVVEAWFKKLDDDRLEVFLKAENIAGVVDTKLRASGSPAAINQVADWFEEHTGLQVNAEWRSKPSRVIEGQMSLTTELSSQDATVPADG